MVLSTGGTAAADPEDEHPPIRDQGGAKCDNAHDARPTFYPGESASHAYDRRFRRLGGPSLPYLGSPDVHGWTPQGLAYWADWDGEGNDLLLVTAYWENEWALIHGIDPETGHHVGSVKIKPTHAGGIAVLGDHAYVSEKGSRGIRYYRLSKLRTWLLAEGTPILEENGRHAMDYGVAFLGTDGSTLYAGMYETQGGLTAPAMASYKATPPGTLIQKGPTYFVPLRTQGMTVVDGDFYFSVSRTPLSEWPGRRSFIYRVSPADMEENRTSWPPKGWHFRKASSCFRAPSMSQGMATHGDKTYLVFESGSGKYTDDPGEPNSTENPPENEVRHVHVGQLGLNDPGDGNVPGTGGTSTTYTGPTEADFHDSFTASARLTGGSGPVSGARMSFTLGNGGGSQSCSGTTDSSGVAACRLRPTQAPGATSLTVRFAGGSGLGPSSDAVPFTITRQETALKYSGPKRVANGTPARLSGVLTEESTDGAAVSGRRVSLALGRGEDRQSCTGTTNGNGKATCTIESVDQPLNDDATVPAAVDFDGDTYYEPSRRRATVLLEYYTGRSYGVAADVNVAGLGAGVRPSPDTGPVRTARASRHAPGCSATVRTLVLRTGTLCPKVVTSLAPGTSRATSAVHDARIGLPGLPVIAVEGATARSTSTCAAGGSARGTTEMRLRVGGRPVEVTGTANAEVNLPGTARLVVNEQRPVPGADHGRTVNALHLTAANGAIDVVIASATSDVHNCAG